MLTCTDGGALLFNYRESLTLGSRKTCEVMAEWGLTVHIGHNDKKSKTEVMCFPSVRTMSKWRIGATIKTYGNDEKEKYDFSLRKLISLLILVKPAIKRRRREKF